MSVYSVVDVLPNLPGYRPRELHSSSRPTTFEIVAGHMFQRDQLPLIGTGGLEESSLSSIGSASRLTKSRSKSPTRGEHLTLTFQAYFEETPSFGPEMGQQRIRRCNIYYFIDDGKLSIVERSQPNSGMTQGTIVKKSFILKPDGSPIVAEDFKIGESITVNGREYNIIDCDGATRRYLGRFAYDSLGDSSVAPSDIFQDTASRSAHSDSWGRYHSKRNQNKTFMEAMLGNTVNNKGREGFMRYGNRTLKFLCVWDNTGTLYGDRVQFSLVYYLSDDTIEIFSVPNAACKEQFSRLLKRSKLARAPTAQTVKPLGEAVDADCYNFRDFYIGMEIPVYARNLRIVDSDTQTREFYEENGLFLGPAEPAPVPVAVFHEREIPPPTAFGSEEDSLRSCQGSLLPGPPHQKKLGEDKKLSFFASLLSGGPDDLDRRFVITYYVQDGTLKVQEPPIRNSGFTGGVFLSRRAIKTESGDALTHRHLYIGCKLQILKHRFLLLDANESTLRWFEDHRLPRASFYDIIDKISPVMINDAQSGRLAQAFKQVEDSPGRVTKEGLAVVLDRYRLRGDGDMDVSEHEILTIVRANGNKLPTFNYLKLIEQIIAPTDEFK